MNILRKTILVLLVLITLLLVVFFVYVSNYYKAVDVTDYLTTNDDVTISVDSDNLWFVPTNEDNIQEEAFVFYPGGLVETKAYAPIMYNLAKEGYVSVIIDMPFKLAMFNSNGANEALSNSKYSDKEWYIGGHSLGGAFAARYYSKHSSSLNGLVLLASYSTYDLSNLDNSNVLSIYGSLDNVLNKDNYEKYKSNLPSNYSEYVIEGGNHGQFGSYGLQSGDNEATITANSQWTLTSNYIIEFMES